MKTKEIPKPELAKLKFANSYALAIIVGIIGFLLYANTIGHGYVYDDDNAVTKNLFVQQGISGIPKIFTVDFWYFQNLKMGYYRPLSLVTFAIENEFFGNNSHVSHFDNALLFGLTGFLLFLFLLQVMSKQHQAFIFLVSLVFVAHPIHTEVVANIKSRDEILSFLNILAMLLCVLRYQKTQKKSAFVWSLVFFYLALISKETATVGIVLLPLVLYYSGNSIPMALKKALPYGAVIILFFLQKRYFLGSDSAIVYNNLNSYPYIDNKLKLPTVFHIFALCLGLLTFPWPLSYDYSYNQVPASHWVDGGAWLGMAIFIGLAILAIVGSFRKTTWGFGLAVIFITLVPSMAFVFLRGGVMAERFLYAPCLGFGILLVYALSMAFQKASSNKLKIPDWIKSNIALTSIIILICIIYSVETIARNKVWKDQFTLFSTDIKYCPGSSQAHTLYGTVLLDSAGREKDSTHRKELFLLGMDQLQKAATINPAYGQTFCDIGFAYSVVEVNKDSALKYYKKCIEIAPDYARAYVNLGILYQNLGKLKLASYCYNKAVELNPLLADGKTNADNLKKATGLDVHVYPAEDTVIIGNQATHINSTATSPENLKKFDSYFKDGADAVKKNDFATGIKYFKKAATIIPDDKQNLLYLANSYGMIKRYNDAVNTFELILKKDPDDQMVIKNLGITYDLMGQKDKGDEVRKKLKQ